jgi:hypothetical protein
LYRKGQVEDDEIKEGRGGGGGGKRKRRRGRRGRIRIRGRGEGGGRGGGGRGGGVQTVATQTLLRWSHYLILLIFNILIHNQ